MIYNMTTPNNKIGFAEAEALKRRERILKLKKKVDSKSNGDETEEKSSQSPGNNISDTESQNDATETPEVENRTTQPSILDEELDLNQLAPRKIDWDLKRDIERKLEILQERTNTAIAELIRDDAVDDI